jgi:hypothetical protein
MLKAVSVQIVEMILHVSLGGFFCMLLRVQMLRVRQVRVMAGLLVVAALVKLGCLSPVASRLFRRVALARHGALLPGRESKNPVFWCVRNQ